MAAKMKVIMALANLYPWLYTKAPRLQTAHAGSFDYLDTWKKYLEMTISWFVILLLNQPSRSDKYVLSCSKHLAISSGYECDWFAWVKCNIWTEWWMKKES